MLENIKNSGEAMKHSALQSGALAFSCVYGALSLASPAGALMWALPVCFALSLALCAPVASEGAGGKILLVLSEAFTVGYMAYAWSERLGTRAVLTVAVGLAAVAFAAAKAKKLGVARAAVLLLPLAAGLFVYYFAAREVEGATNGLPGIGCVLLFTAGLPCMPISGERLAVGRSKLRAAAPALCGTLCAWLLFALSIGKAETEITAAAGAVFTGIRITEAICSVRRMTRRGEWRVEENKE